MEGSFPQLNEEGRDEKGYTQLHWHVFSKNLEAVKNVVALIWGAMNGALRICVYLIEQGADVGHKDVWGFNALFHAVQNGHVFLVHMLLDKGCDMYERDKEGHTLLHWAIYKDKVKMITYLLNRGIDINSSDDKKATGVHWAAIRGHHHIISLLIERNAKTEEKDINGKTPLDLAKEGSFVQTRCVAELQRDRTAMKTYFGMSERTQLWWMVFLGFPLYWSLIGYVSALFIIPMFMGMFIVMNSGNFMSKHMMGANGYRSSVAFGLLCSTCLGIYYYHAMYVVVGDASILTFVFYLCMGLLMYFLYKTKQNPGTIEKNQWEGIEWKKVQNLNFCPFCMTRTPIRSHHCRRCDQCVGRFDHHCAWLDHCVGYSNSKWFLLLLVDACICHCLWFYQSYFFLIDKWDSGVLWLNYHSFVMFFVLQIFQFFGQLVLCYSIAQTCTQDETTYEMSMKHHKHDNLSCPLHDRGTMLNVKQFFGVAGKDQIDWRIVTEDYDNGLSGECVHYD